MQAMIAEDVLSHAAAPTLEEAQAAIALIGSLALHQLEGWAAASQQAFEPLADLSSKPASQVGWTMQQATRTRYTIRALQQRLMQPL